MAAYTVQTLTEDFGALTFASVASSDTFANTGKEILIVNNENAGTVQVTIQADGVAASFTVPGYGKVEKADRVVNVTTGNIAAFGTFPRAAYNDSSGDITVAYDVTSNVSAAVVKIP